MLGVKFVDMFNGANTDTVRQEWSHVLAEFKPIELERGLAEVARRKFVPTLGEFTNLCRPCLDPEWAFHEAEGCLRQRDKGEIGDWSHPAVYRAARELATEVRQSQYKAVAKRWEVTLKRELAKGWGDPIPEPQRVLANNAQTRPPTSREREQIASLLQTSRQSIAEKQLAMKEDRPIIDMPKE